MNEQDIRRSRDRRAFLKDLAALGLGGAAVLGSAGPARAAAVLLPAAQATKPDLDHLGVQLYSVRDLLQSDFEGTIEKVAALGYKNVEFAGYNGRTPEQVRALLDRLKLAAPSAHIPLTLLRSDLEGQIHAAEVVGHKYITVPSLGRSETPMTTADAWKRVAEEFNRIGTTVKSRGHNLAFHSHSAEFVDVGGGKTGMDVFISETDPALVSFEMDLMWARVASQNPVEWFARYPGRFKLWHVKDMRNLKAAQAQQAAAFRNPAPAGPPPRPPASGAAAGGATPQGARAGGRGAPRAGQMAPVGSGEIAFKPIFAAWQRAGLDYFFVEHDTAAEWPGGALASIGASYRYLRQLLA